MGRSQFSSKIDSLEKYIIIMNDEKMKDFWMVICTIREFSFLLELKDLFFWGDFYPFTLSEGLRILSLSVTVDPEIARMKKQVEILNDYFQ